MAHFVTLELSSSSIVWDKVYFEMCVWNDWICLIQSSKDLRLFWQVEFSWWKFASQGQLCRSLSFCQCWLVLCYNLLPPIQRIILTLQDHRKSIDILTIIAPKGDLDFRADVLPARIWSYHMTRSKSDILFEIDKFQLYKMSCKIEPRYFVAHLISLQRF